MITGLGSILGIRAFVAIALAFDFAGALRRSTVDRRFPRRTAWAGLGSCAFLAVWLEPPVVAIGGAVIASGLAWRVVWRQRERT